MYAIFSSLVYVVFKKSLVYLAFNAQCTYIKTGLNFYFVKGTLTRKRVSKKQMGVRLKPSI
jgi:hypothetical protein